MNIEQKREALTLTQKIMEVWYACDSSLVCSYLDEDVVWIGSTDKQFFVGKAAVLEALRYANEELLPCRLSQQNYMLGAAGTETCLCIGRYIATLDTDQMFMSEPQRVTFLWRTVNGELKITHIHVSNVAAVVAPDEEFPIKASRQNYEYVQKKLAEQDEIIKISTTDYAFHLLNRSSIVYLESSNANVVIHYADGEQFTVHMQLQTFLQEQCPDFIRIHRSYAINPYRVRMLKNQKVILDNDEALPVSRNSYAGALERIHKLF